MPAHVKAALALTVLIAFWPAAAHASVRVTVQGDSLSVAARPYLPAALGSARLISHSAKVGRRTDTGLELLRRQRLGDVIAVALGTNDYQASAQWFTRRLKRALTLAGPKRCVVVATVYAYRPALQINRSITRIARRYGPDRIQVAQWSRAVTRGRVHLADGVHPASAAGARLRARLIAGAVRRCAHG